MKIQSICFFFLPLLTFSVFTFHTRSVSVVAAVGTTSEDAAPKLAKSLEDSTADAKSEPEEDEISSSGDVVQPEDYRSNPEAYFFYLPYPDASNIREEHAPLDEKQRETPSFLYKPLDYFRVVEFYAHWCPHCQHFRAHFIDVATKVKSMSKKYGISVEFYAVSCVPHRSLCIDQNVTSYPRVKLFRPGSTNATQLNFWEVHPFEVFEAMEVEVEIEGRETSAAASNTDTSRATNGQQALSTSNHFLPRTKREIYNDAWLSFDFAMKQGIFTSPGSLTNSTADGFKDFLELLHYSLPPMFGLRRLVGKLLTDFDRVRESEKELLRIVKSHSPKESTWSPACTRGDPYAGYTCGLWELFHIVSIGVVEWNIEAVGDDEIFFHTEDAAESLRSFVSNFFGCEVCRLHFLASFDSCAFDRCNRLTTSIGEFKDWQEFPMWLFETHNGVNVRLMKERAEKNKVVPSIDDERAVTWPSKEDCPMCWHADGRWDLDSVYLFLRLTYWPDDELSDEYHQALFSDVRATVDEEEEWQSYLFCFVCFVIGIIGLPLLSKWAATKFYIERTGRHKKKDDSSPV